MSAPTTDWLDVLRAACAAQSQTQVARLLGYSVTVVNQVLKSTYKGDLSRIQAAVEGALMHAEVECPVAGLIPRQRCIEHQRRPFAPTNPMNVQLYRACRSGCPHSLLSPDPRFAGHAQPEVAPNTGSRSAVSSPPRRGTCRPAAVSGHSNTHHEGD